MEIPYSIGTVIRFAITGYPADASRVSRYVVCCDIRIRINAVPRSSAPSIVQATCIFNLPASNDTHPSPKYTRETIATTAIIIRALCGCDVYQVDSLGKYLNSSWINAPTSARMITVKLVSITKTSIHFPRPAGLPVPKYIVQHILVD